MVFEILATIAVLAVMVAITATMVDIMDGLDKAGVRFVPAAWFVTAWGIVTSFAGSIFLIDIIRQVCS